MRPSRFMMIICMVCLDVFLFGPPLRAGEEPGDRQEEPQKVRPGQEQEKGEMKPQEKKKEPTVQDLLDRIEALELEVQDLREQRTGSPRKEEAPQRFGADLSTMGVSPDLMGNLGQTTRFSRTFNPAVGAVLDPIFPLTVEEVAAMGAFPRFRRMGLEPGEEKRFIAECLGRVGMESFRKRLFADLSAGQKQRILIARALATRPDLLLLDEPTSGVVQAAESAIVDLLETLNASGIAVVLVCHEMDMVRRCVRDVIWVNRGRIERGSVEEMLSAAMVRERLETGGEAR